jgi:hypothetical protein
VRAGTEYDGVTHLQTNISLADAWLYGMAAGAASSNRTVQYCMPYPNDLLSASAYPAVTNARATGDYFHSADQVCQYFSTACDLRVRVCGHGLTHIFHSTHVCSGP